MIPLGNDDWDDGMNPAPSQTKTPFQRVVDDLTDGCGCACHTGTGYRSSCDHCWPAAAGQTWPGYWREPKSVPRWLWLVLWTVFVLSILEGILRGVGLFT